MANLTDLPIEILELIFREFLSHYLIEDENLCVWYLGYGARRIRATLYALSLVSKAISKVALPLLYEQLFESKDLARITSIDTVSDSVKPLLAFTRYLCISLSAQKGHPGGLQAYSASSQQYLAYCVRVKAVEVFCHGEAAAASAFLLALAGLPGFQGLQSLTVMANTSGPGVTVFCDVSHFKNLVGLQIECCSALGDWPVARPNRPLEHLRELQMAYATQSAEYAACMALAPTKHLQTLEFYFCDYDNSSNDFVAEAFAAHTLESLVYLGLPRFAASDPAPFSSHSNRFPLLQHLAVRTFSPAILEEETPIYPYMRVALQIINVDVQDFVLVLAGIIRGHWLGDRFDSIELEVQALDDWLDPVLEDPLYDGERVSRSECTSLATQAIEAALEMGIELEPGDLVKQISKWRFAEE